MDTPGLNEDGYAVVGDPGGAKHGFLDSLEEFETRHGVNKPWKQNTWKERFTKTAYYTGAAVAGTLAVVAAAGIALEAAGGGRRSQQGGYGYAPIESVPAGYETEQHEWAQRTAALHAQQQWQPWMSQGQLNPYDGQTYYPMHYGTQF